MGEGDLVSKMPEVDGRYKKHASECNGAHPTPCQQKRKHYQQTNGKEPNRDPPTLRRRSDYDLRLRCRIKQRSPKRIVSQGRVCLIDLDSDHNPQIGVAACLWSPRQALQLTQPDRQIEFRLPGPNAPPGCGPGSRSRLSCQYVFELSDERACRYRCGHLTTLLTHLTAMSDLDQLLRLHLEQPFPPSLEKGLDYAMVDPVVIDSDIFGWGTKALREGKLDRVTLDALHEAQEQLANSLGAFPASAVPYFRRLLEIAKIALALGS